MKLNLKVKPRQSGKTYKLIGKMFKYQSKGKKPIMFTYNGNNAKSITHRINIMPGSHTELPNRVHNYKNWEAVLCSNDTKVIILDEFKYFKPKELKKILKFAKKQNIKVIGYSSQDGE